MGVTEVRVQIEPVEPGLAIWRSTRLRIRVHDLDADWHLTPLSSAGTFYGFVYCGPYGRPSIYYGDDFHDDLRLEDIRSVALKVSDVGWVCPDGIHAGRYEVEGWREVPDIREIAMRAEFTP